jgi:type I restriction enzyme S subunit
MSKEKLIPEFRFPEFKDSGEWDVKTLGEVLIKNSKKNKNQKYSQVESVSNKFGFIKQDEYFKNRRVASKDTSNYYVIKKGYFAYNPSRIDVGSLAYKHNDEISIISPLYVSFKANNELINDYFLLSFFNSVTFTKQMIFEGGVRNTLNYDNLIQSKIPIPTIQEQQRIASCLSSLDEVIEAHSKKLELLKDHKKGLLQNLFPQEGETVPKVRFPEFEGDGEWEIKRVEDFFDVGSSKRVLQKDWTNDGVPFYRTRELVSLSKNEPFGSEIFISEDLYIELKESYGVPVEGDFLVSGVGTLGVIYQVKKEDKFYFKDGNVIWFSKREELDSSFFEFCFESSHIQNQIDAQTSKSTVGTYTIKNARITEFWHPPRIEEQQKIASCLSAVDELITAQQDKIEQLQQHKKGLMQGLFPKIND